MAMGIAMGMAVGPILKLNVVEQNRMTPLLTWNSMAPERPTLTLYYVNNTGSI